MNNIDKKIREALGDSPESEELFVEQNLIAEVVAPFRGKRKWVNAVGLFYGLVGMGLMLWAGYHFYVAELVREQLLWGGLALFGVLFVSFLKIYFWMEMHTNRILREVKRVELLLLQTKG